MDTTDPNRPTLEGDINQQYITRMIHDINARLAPLDYEIRNTKDQTSKILIYALINTTSDSLTQLATTFTPDEIAYIKRLLDCMFEDNNTKSREIMAVPRVQAAQLARAPRPRQSQINGEDSVNQTDASAKSLSISDSEHVLQQLVDQAFFNKSRKGYYSLAPRALMELRTYLKETYNESADPDDPEYDPIIRIKDCEGCREIVTVGLRCSNRDCGTRLHELCAAQLFRGQRGNKQCPNCGVGWTGDYFVGEKADTTQRRSMNVVGRVSNVTMEEADGGEEQEGEEDDEDE